MALLLAASLVERRSYLSTNFKPRDEFSDFSRALLMPKTTTPIAAQPATRRACTAYLSLRLIPRHFAYAVLAMSRAFQSIYCGPAMKHDKIHRSSGSHKQVSSSRLHADFRRRRSADGSGLFMPRKRTLQHGNIWQKRPVEDRLSLSYCCHIIIISHDTW